MLSFIYLFHFKCSILTISKRIVSVPVCCANKTDNWNHQVNTCIIYHLILWADSLYCNVPFLKNRLWFFLSYIAGYLAKSTAVQGRGIKLFFFFLLLLILLVCSCLFLLANNETTSTSQHEKPIDGCSSHGYSWDSAQSDGFGSLSPLPLPLIEREGQGEVNLLGRPQLLGLFSYARTIIQN